MTTKSSQTIQNAVESVSDQDSFIQGLLVDALGWPIEEEISDVEDITFEWSADDLRSADLDKKLVDGKILQIRPFPGNPWGVFLLEFNNEEVFTKNRGMTGILRQVLRGLVPSKRKNSNLASFKRENLLFICNHDYKHFRFAHFKNPKNPKRAEPLAAFGWGPGDPIRTLCEFNLNALTWPGGDAVDEQSWLSEWSEAFDVEKVTERFYKDYAGVFAAAEQEIGMASKLSGEDLRMFTQTLFNRLMFIRFVERKEWLTFGEGNNYLKDLHAAGGVKKQSLYKSRIRPLFFEGLAIEGNQSSEAYGEVPFLNGGLFEEAELDSKVKDIPDSVFGRIISSNGLFYQYNFTVEESTPLEIEVAVDPEMLGKVFEELVTGRHESGSYYTPRQVVSFMCREALKAVLEEKTGASESAINLLVDENQIGRLSVSRAREIVKVLDELTAVDPACGSGAYLLGLLHEMLAIYNVLYSKDLKSDSRSLYELKLDIITKNLYGVDIDPFATNIAMLRLWLSLAVEADNPVPLPNLDFKIETGDSLLADDPQSSPDLFRFKMQNMADALVLLKQGFISSTGNEKRQLRQLIQDTESELRDELDEQFGENVVDWRIQFAEVFASNRKGFDIVLANPPYGLLNKKQNQKLGHSISLEAKKRLKQSAEFAPAMRGMVNVCSLFIRRSFSLLRPNGVFVEIFPLAFTCDWSYAPLRSYILNYHQLLQVEAFPERDDHRRRVFSSAKMSVCILIAKHGRGKSKQVVKLRIHDTPFVDTSKQTVLLKASDIAQFDTNFSIPLVSQNDIDLLSQIYKNSVRLSEIGNCFTGEIDLTICRPFINSNPRNSVMHKGAIIGRYQVRNSMSQGEIEYLDAKAYLKAKGKRQTSSAWHHRDPRIILQGITGVNEKRRLKMAYLNAGAFCANSANYIRLNEQEESNYLFTLAVLNSNVANFVFKCFSTNSNVNGYEVNNLPIPKCTEEDRNKLAGLAEKCLNSKSPSDVTRYQNEIEELVRRLFGLPPDIQKTENNKSTRPNA